MKPTRWAAFLLVAATAYSQEIVDTSEGPVRGERGGNSWSYRAIPFAAPPVGELRWNPPVPPAPRAGLLEAVSWGPLCPQLSGNSVVGEEDCLQLNIWTPQSPREAPAPVLFWIHGGGHVQGGAPARQGGLRIYDGARLAEAGGVIVVTINYRLGPLGFLALPELSSQEGSSGNLGTLDQIAALEWVRRNIPNFGGDPKRVMIAGESAGGVSVCSLMTSPQASGLFHAAVIQSGGCAARPLERAESFGRSLAETLGCQDDTAVCLRSRTPAQLLEAIPTGFNISTESSDYGSVVDGVIQPAPPMEVIGRGEHARVPVIVGANSDETSQSAPPIRTAAEYAALVRQQFRSPLLTAMILAEYPPDEYKSPQAAFVALTSDSRFICPSRRTAAALRGAQDEPVYRYFFTHSPENASPAVRDDGAWHGLDVPYLFQQTDRIPGYRAGETDAAVESAFASYWASLAAAGSPNSGQFIEWPQSDAADSYLELASPLRTGQGISTRQCDFWDRLQRLLQ